MKNNENGNQIKQSCCKNLAEKKLKKLCAFNKVTMTTFIRHIGYVTNNKVLDMPNHS